MPQSWRFTLWISVVAGIAAIIGVVVVAAVQWGDDGSVAKGPWVTENEKGLSEIPVFQDLPLANSYSVGHGLGEGGTPPYDGYTTWHWYRLPPGTDSKTVLAFYERKLVPRGWTKTGHSGCEVWFGGKAGAFRVSACNNSLGLGYKFGG